MKTYSFSLTGPRGENQDAVASWIKGGSVLAVVADGVGGLSFGGEAARLVVKAVESLVAMSSANPIEALRRAHGAINRLETSEAVASTGTVALITASSLKFAHTGDSRIYVIRGNGLKTLTNDQTEVAYLLKEGVLSPAEARTYPRKNVLLNSLEKGQELSAEEGDFILQPGDRVLMLTDGVYKAIEKAEIRDMSRHFAEGDDFFKELETIVSERLKDDASCLFVEL